MVESSNPYRHAVTSIQSLVHVKRRRGRPPETHVLALRGLKAHHHEKKPDLGSNARDPESAMPVLA